MIRNIAIQGGQFKVGNTYEDFVYTLTNITSCLEIDFILNADGSLISGHDNSCYGKLISESKDSDILKRNGFRGCSLKDILNIKLNKLIFCDLKNKDPRSIEYCLEVIEETNSYNDVVLMVYEITDEMLNLVKSKNIKTCWKIPSALTDENKILQIIKDVRADYDFICIEYERLNPIILSECKDSIEIIAVAWRISSTDYKIVLDFLEEKNLKNVISPIPHVFGPLLKPN